MARYIDVKEVENTKTMIYGLLQEFIDEYRIYSTSSIDYHGGRADGVETARTMVIRRLNTLLEQPTADVEEVKHGEWKQGIPYICSVCGKPAPDEKNTSEKYSCWTSPYCPNCGAKMDGGNVE